MRQTHGWTPIGGQSSEPLHSNYQNMPQDQRLRLRMDREPVSEIDISASFLTIFYALMASALNDAYGNIVGRNATRPTMSAFEVVP
jgi:hypothetical protein